MGEKNYLNKKSSNYFPGDAPTWFSYTLDFATGGRRKNLGMIHVAGTAYKKLTGERIDFHRSILDNPEVIGHLKALAAAARAEELDFLNRYGIQLYNNDWGGLIKSFTLFYSHKAAFERNLQLLNQLVDKNDSLKIYHNFITHYGTYLRDAVNELVPKSSLAKGTTSMDVAFKQLMEDIIKLSLTKMFNMRDARMSNGRLETHHVERDKLLNTNQATEVKTLKSMLNIIDIFQNNDFLSGLNEIWDLENLVLDMINDTQNATTTFIFDVHSFGSKKGTLAEFFEHAFAGEASKQLNNLIIGRGQSDLWIEINAKSLNANGKMSESGVKADVTSFRGSKAAEAKLRMINNTGDNNSKRVNAIQKYKKWFEEFGHAKNELVFISDKNYQIKNKFDGFEAQGNTSLENLRELLTEIGTIKGESITSLIDYLANCGADMLLGRAENEVLDTIALQIGSFLFDDLEITGDFNTKRVHLLSLSGFYVPLSVYLEGLIEAINETREEMKGFVTVSFKPAGAEGAASPWESKKDFEDFREKQLQNSYISVHFMKNFAQFITSHVHF